MHGINGNSARRKAKQSRKTTAARAGLESLEARQYFTTTAVGVNVEAVSDYSRSFMFADAMKSARRFGTVGSPWDEAAPVDEQGWPVGDAAATVVVVDNVGPTPIRIDGTYKFSARGQVIVSPVASDAYVTNWQYDASTDTTTADVVVRPGANALHLNFRGDPDGAKEMQLWRPGTVPGQTFTDEFLQSLEGVQTLRMMDFARTNTTQVREWADRALPTDATQALESKGAAWEYAIELANTLDKDLWVNVPVLASDDYVAQMAALLRDTLEPGLKVYVEYSNELWNFAFQQFQGNYDAAQAEVAINQYDLNWDRADNTYQYAWRRVAKRLVEIKDVFAGVYGWEAINDTVRPVLASQIGWSYVLKDQLDYLEHRFGTDLSQQIYAVAGAPYMSIGDTLSHSASLTVDQIFMALNENLAGMQEGIQKYEVLANNHRVNYLYYEGGIDLQGNTGGNFYGAKLPANYDPRMYDLVRSYLVNAFNNGVDGVMYYSQISTYTPWGTWGLTDSVQAQDSAKMRAFRSVSAEEMPGTTTGVQLPVGFGGVTTEAGTYLLDRWANQGRGGAIEGTGAGGQYSYLLNVTYPDELMIQLTTSTLYGDGVIEVVVDGQAMGWINLPETRTMSQYKNTEALRLTDLWGMPLSAGHHTLKLRVISGYLNIQSFTIGTGGYEAPPPVVPQIPVPLSPSDVTAVAASSTQIKLTWTDVSGETGYKVERSLDGTSWVEVAAAAMDAVTYTDTGLTPGTKYWYRLRAVNQGGESPYSPVVSASTKLPAPQGVTAAAITPTAVEVRWSPVTGAASYMIQRSLNGKTWTDLTRVSRTMSTYTDYGVSANTNYSYRIVAVALDGTRSELSSVVSVRTKKK